MPESTLRRTEVVLVRAAGSEPVRLWVVNADSSHVELAEIGGSARIIFPATEVFVNDDKLYEHLRTAYEDGDALKLF